VELASSLIRRSAATGKRSGLLLEPARARRTIYPIDIVVLIVEIDQLVVQVVFVVFVVLVVEIILIVEVIIIIEIVLIVLVVEIDVVIEIIVLVADTCIVERFILEIVRLAPGRERQIRLELGRHCSILLAEKHGKGHAGPRY
jgi:hypothetical protein